MFLYSILQAPNIDIDPSVIDDIVSAVAKKVEKQQSGTLNIVFVWSDEIKELNNTHRKIDKDTDVLSFHYYDDFESLEDDEIAWEIVLCLDKIAPDAKRNSISKSRQVYILLIHSMLHILWYDHLGDDDYKTMNTLEKSIYREIFGEELD